jgi:hypothetical protein
VAVQAEQPKAHARKPKRLLSGLMKCSLCGSAMTLKGDKYNCSGRYDRGTCANGKIIAAKTVEGRALAGIKAHLLSPEAISEAVKAFHAAAEAERRALLIEPAPLERELAEIERKLKRAQAMCLDGAIETSELKSISAPLNTRRAEIQSRLSNEEAPSVIQLHPGAADAYRRLAEDLHQAIEGDDGQEVRAELRKLIERVDFIPAEGLGQFDLRVHGSLAGCWRWVRPKKQKTSQAGPVRYFWVREQDLNLRPSGYEPDELPGCSIPRQGGVRRKKGSKTSGSQVARSAVDLLNNDLVYLVDPAATYSPAP